MVVAVVVVVEAVVVVVVNVVVVVISVELRKEIVSSASDMATVSFIADSVASSIAAFSFAAKNIFCHAYFLLLPKIKYILTDTGEDVQTWTRVFSTRR